MVPPFVPTGYYPPPPPMYNGPHPHYGYNYPPPPPYYGGYPMGMDPYYDPSMHYNGPPPEQHHRQQHRPWVFWIISQPFPFSRQNLSLKPSQLTWLTASTSSILRTTTWRNTTIKTTTTTAMLHGGRSSHKRYQLWTRLKTTSNKICSLFLAIF